MMRFNWAKKGLIAMSLLMSAGMASAMIPILMTVKSTDSTFKIILEGNPTTGYQWFLNDQYDHHLIAAKKFYIEKEGNSKLVGAPSKSVFVFKVKKGAFLVPSIIHLNFSYQRAFENTVAKTASATIFTVPSAP